MKATVNPFPALPVLEALKSRLSRLSNSPMRTTRFVCVQHLLRSTGSLFQSLIDLGVDPQRINVIGKLYSTSSEVETHLRMSGINLYDLPMTTPPGAFAEHLENVINSVWHLVEDSCRTERPHKVVLIDDGGHLHKTLPSSILARNDTIGIEQTTSGVAYHTRPFRSIQVASSAAKRYLESRLISRAVAEKLKGLGILQEKPLVCGIVGIGHIGKTIATEMRGLGHSVLLYDVNDNLREDLPAFSWCNELSELLDRSQLILGCSGEDIFSDVSVLSTVTGDKYLASCSSEEREFLSLLKIAAANSMPTSPSKDIVFSTSKGSLTLLRSGFPVNFDQSGESVPDRDIQLTRGLLLGAIAQAILCENASPGNNPKEMLSPAIQRFVKNVWLESENRHNLYSSQVINWFDDIQWIKTNSGGIENHCPAINACLR